MNSLRDILIAFTLFIKEHDLDELIDHEEELVDKFIKENEEAAK